MGWGGLGCCWHSVQRGLKEVILCVEMTGAMFVLLGRD